MLRLALDVWLSFEISIHVCRRLHQRRKFRALWLITCPSELRKVAKSRWGTVHDYQCTSIQARNFLSASIAQFIEQFQDNESKAQKILYTRQPYTRSIQVPSRGAFLLLPPVSTHDILVRLDSASDTPSAITPISSRKHKRIMRNFLYPLLAFAI